MRRLTAATLIVLGFSTWSGTARAAIAIGATAPDFSKAELVGSSAGPQHTLYQHADIPVVILFLLGYN